MSVRHSKSVWVNSKAKPFPRLVLLAIADHINSECERAWPSVERLVKYTGMARSSLHEAFKELVELGELKIHYNAGKGGVNEYEILLPIEADEGSGSRTEGVRETDGGGPPDGRTVSWSRTQNQDRTIKEPGTLRGLKNLSATRNGSSKSLLSDEEFLSGLKEKNPDLDVDLEWRKLHTWCLANPGKQPTRKRFANWLIRADRKVRMPRPEIF